MAGPRPPRRACTGAATPVSDLPHRDHLKLVLFTISFGDRHRPADRQGNRIHLDHRRQQRDIFVLEHEPPLRSEHDAALRRAVAGSQPPATTAIMAMANRVGIDTSVGAQGQVELIKPPTFAEGELWFSPKLELDEGYPGCHRAGPPVADPCAARADLLPSSIPTTPRGPH